MAIARIKIACDDYEIGYEIQGKSPKCMLIIHGWGASRVIMQNAFKDNFKDYTKLFVDLAGFGKSNIKRSINSFEYTKIIEFFLKKIAFKPSYILAHSFGCKIAANLALENKNINLILMSSPGIITTKSLKVRSKIMLFKTLKVLNIQGLDNIFLSADAKDLNPILQKSFKLIVNEDYELIFKKILNKTLICWGENDDITPISLAAKLSSLIKNSKLTVLEGDHFFFLKQADLIEKNVKNYFENGII